jgi:tetratricopeptide (TPR) repeat protein
VRHENIVPYHIWSNGFTRILKIIEELLKPESLVSTGSRPPLPELTVEKSVGTSRINGFVWLLGLALVALTLGVYMPVGNHPFFIFDNIDKITNNPHLAGGLTAENIRWAFTSVEAFNWHPLTWLSHMAVADFYGMNPRPHHLANVVIHAASALLLFLLLFRQTGARWHSIIVAALFALHPLHVESVAWVAERKDMLSALFCFLTLWSYAEYAAKRRTGWYLCALVLFALGLMSKAMLVTLPLVMLLIDFWPLDRYRQQEQEPAQRSLSRELVGLVKEKIPFLVCSLCSGLITIHAQQQGGVMQGFREIPLWFRSENALVAYVRYIAKTFWPTDLAVLYPFPPSIRLWQVVGSALILLLISAAAVRGRHRFPYIAVGWFWFLITLVPVIGLIQVGAQAMADRYSYLPVTGLFIAVTWGVADLAKGARHRQLVAALLAVAVISASAAITRRQLGYWQDSATLFRHTLQVTTGNAEINYNLGRLLHDRGELDAAIPYYREALRLNPNDMDAHNNMGNIFQAKGDPDAAIRQYREALQIAPNDFNARYNLGVVFQATGNPDAAIEQYQRALQISPDDSNAHGNLGVVFHTKGNLDAAIREYQEALRANHDNVAARNNLSIATALNSRGHRF